MSELTPLRDAYAVGEVLGRGGFGVVRKGRHLPSGRSVAVKFCRLPDEEARRRVLREARLLATVKHPRLASLQGIHTASDGEVALVFQFLPGRTMGERLASEGLPDRETALAWAADIASGLEALHSRGLVHRDLKPENLMLGPDGRVTLLDFGLSRLAREGDTVTAEGVVLGTPWYMAPEIVRGLRPGPPSDVYSLACLIHELATGRRPFEGEALEVIRAHLEKDPPPLSGWISPLEAALHKEPSRRPGSAAELVELLRGIPAPAPTMPRRLSRLLPRPRSVSTARRRRRSGLLLPFLASAGLAGLLGVALVAAGRTPSEPAPPPTSREDPAAPQRRLPRRGFGVLYRQGTDRFRLPARLRFGPLPLEPGRLAYSTEGGHMAVLDVVRGTVELIQPVPPQTSHGLGFVFPDGNGGAWANRRIRGTQYLCRLAPPFTREPTDLRELGSVAQNWWYVGELPDGRRLGYGERIDQAGVHLETLAFDPDGPLLRRNLDVLGKGGRPLAMRLSLQPPGYVQHWIETEGKRTRNLVALLAPDGSRRARLVLPPERPLQAHPLTTPEGLVLVTGGRLYRIPSPALEGDLDESNLQAISAPLFSGEMRARYRVNTHVFSEGGSLLVLHVPPIPMRGALEKMRLLVHRLPDGELGPEAAPPARTELLPILAVLGISSVELRYPTVLEGGRYFTLAISIRDGESAFLLGDLRTGELLLNEALSISGTSAGFPLCGPPALVPVPGRDGTSLLLPVGNSRFEKLVLERFFSREELPLR